MVTPTPEELRQAADVVERFNIHYGLNENARPVGLRAFAEKLEAEAEKTARRDRLVEELAELMCEAALITNSWDSTINRDAWRGTARAVIDRFPILLEADE